MSLLSVQDLTIRFRTDEGLITAVENVSFDIQHGEVLGLVGESGSGKSVTAKALMQLNGRNTVYDPASKITLHGEPDGSAPRAFRRSLPGGCAMEALEELAIRTGFARITLFTAQVHTNLVAFYSSLGYRVTDLRPPESGKDDIPRIYMSKFLN